MKCHAHHVHGSLARFPLGLKTTFCLEWNCSKHIGFLPLGVSVTFGEDSDATIWTVEDRYFPVAGKTLTLTYVGDVYSCSNVIIK